MRRISRRQGPGKRYGKTMAHAQGSILHRLHTDFIKFVSQDLAMRKAQRRHGLLERPRVCSYRGFSIEAA